MSITLVTAFWRLGSAKYSSDQYVQWLNNTLAIRAPMVCIVGHPEDGALFKDIRKDLPTVILVKSIDTFRCISFDKCTDRVHPIHVPSVNLGRIWLEKIFLLEDVIQLNPFDTDWFSWYDAGNAQFRDTSPPPVQWPSVGMLAKLDANCMNYAETPPPLIYYVKDQQDAYVVKYNQEYPKKLKSGIHIHKVTGTWYILHKDMCLTLRDLFQEYLQKVRKASKDTEPWSAMSDQTVWSWVKLDHPELFHKLSTGYGNLFDVLTE